MANIFGRKNAENESSEASFSTSKHLVRGKSEKSFCWKFFKFLAYNDIFLQNVLLHFLLGNQIITCVVNEK